MDKRMASSGGGSKEAVPAVESHMALITGVEAVTLTEAVAVAATPILCGHGRLIEDVIKRGKRTGKVRCVECGSTFEDPYRGTR